MSHIIRLELDDGNSEDFTILHKLMDKGNFYQTIISDSRREYHLPRATYLSKDSSSCKEVLDSVKSILKSMNKTGEILVVEYKSLTWSNLAEV